MRNGWLWRMGLGCLVAVATACAASGATKAADAKVAKAAKPTTAEVRKAVDDGTLVRLKTTPDEFKKLFGQPKSERPDRGGTMESVILEYDGFSAAFMRDTRTKDPLTLLGLDLGEGWPDRSSSELIGKKPLEEEPPARAMSAQEVVRNLPKIDRRPRADSWVFWKLPSVPKYDPKSNDPFQLDLRMADLSGLDLRRSGKDLAHALFETETLWPSADKLPAGFDPKAVMELGKNPGLGVRGLHAKGVTGKGVRIAIIDHPLQIEHAEFGNRILLYEEINVASGVPAQMHGAATASIAVGKTVGVAPEAELFFISAFAFDVKAKRTSAEAAQRDFGWYAKAVRRLVDINRQLPEGGKIRAISMSVGWAPSEKGAAEMDAAVKEAVKEGMLVVSSNTQETHGVGIMGLGRAPKADPDKLESYGPAPWWMKAFTSGRVPQGLIMCPMDSRTTAGPLGKEDYAFYGSAGLSWVPPYLAGVYALACQAKPEITPDEFLKLAVKTGRTIDVRTGNTTRKLGLVIDPPAIIQALKAASSPKQATRGKR